MDLSTIIIVAVVSIFGAISIGVFLALRREIFELRNRAANDQSMTMLNQNLSTLQQRIDATTQAVNQRLDKAAVVIQGLMKEAGTMNEIGRTMKEFQEYLNSPKIRGNIGEQVLNEALRQVFSADQYDLQFRFQDGQTVDALVRATNGFIPIDAKFPLEDYRRMMNAQSEDEKKRFMKDFERSVKKHIDDIARKYILPQEGTVDFAVMYVPSEGIYYEIIVESEEVMRHARERRILLVSPNTFFQFLRVILMGMERVKLAEEAQRVWEALMGIQTDAGKFGESLALVSKHLTNAKNAADSATSEYVRFANKIDQIKLLK